MLLMNYDIYKRDPNEAAKTIRDHPYTQDFIAELKAYRTRKHKDSVGDAAELVMHLTAEMHGDAGYLSIGGAMLNWKAICHSTGEKLQVKFGIEI